METRVSGGVCGKARYVQDHNASCPYHPLHITPYTSPLSFPSQSFSPLHSPTNPSYSFPPTHTPTHTNTPPPPHPHIPTPAEMHPEVTPTPGVPAPTGHWPSPWGCTVAAVVHVGDAVHGAVGHWWCRGCPGTTGGWNIHGGPIGNLRGGWEGTGGVGGWVGVGVYTLCLCSVDCFILSTAFMLFLGTYILVHHNTTQQHKCTCPTQHTNSPRVKNRLNFVVNSTTSCCVGGSGCLARLHKTSKRSLQLSSSTRACTAALRACMRRGE